jgi:hypothetical protein
LSFESLFSGDMPIPMGGPRPAPGPSPLQGAAPVQQQQQQAQRAQQVAAHQVPYKRCESVADR